MTDARYAILRKVPAFAGLADEDCDAVLRVVRARKGNHGDVLFRQDQPGDAMVIVLEGELSCTVRAPEGEREIARLGPGELVGEMALFDNEPRSATVRTDRGATVLELSRAALARLRIEAPRVCAQIHGNMLLAIARRLREAGSLVRDVPSRASAPPSSPASRRRLGVSELRAFPILADRTDADLELLGYVSTLRAFRPGEDLMRQGDAGDACFFLLAGSVSVTRSDRAEPLATLTSGALVGQLSLIDRAPRSATVSALSDVAALEIPAASFGNLLRSHVAIALRFQEQVCLAGVRQLRAATARRAQEGSPSSVRTLDVDDWEDPETNVTLELAIDPRLRA